MQPEINHAIQGYVTEISADMLHMVLTVNQFLKGQQLRSKIYIINYGNSNSNKLY